MMLRFAAPRLCGRARDGSLAAIVVVSLDLAGSIVGPASCDGLPRDRRHYRERAHVFAARERRTASRFKKEEAPVWGGWPGLPNGRSPWGREI